MLASASRRPTICVSVNSSGSSTPRTPEVLLWSAERVSTRQESPSRQAVTAQIGSSTLSGACGAQIDIVLVGVLVAPRLGHASMPTAVGRGPLTTTKRTTTRRRRKCSCRCSSRQLVSSVARVPNETCPFPQAVSVLRAERTDRTALACRRYERDLKPTPNQSRLEPYLRRDGRYRRLHSQRRYRPLVPWRRAFFPRPGRTGQVATGAPADHYHRSSRLSPSRPGPLRRRGRVPGPCHWGARSDWLARSSGRRHRSARRGSRPHPGMCGAEALDTRTLLQLTCNKMTSWRG